MAEYEIVNIRPLVDIDERGRFIKIYRVYYKLPNGEEDWIDIPADKFTESYARKLIEEKVEEVKKLLSSK